MFIIVEGPKCVGKTTLCNTLSKKFNMPIIHFPTNSKLGKRAYEMMSIPGKYNEAQELMEQDIDNTLSQIEENCILDRSFISNAIYRNDEHIIIKDKYMKILEKSMLIVLLASTENIYKWIKLRTDKPLTQVEQSKIEWSNERFHKLSDILECKPLGEREIKQGYWYIERD